MIFCGGSTTLRIYKFQKSDLAKLGESSIFGTIRALTEDDDYIYCGDTDNKIRKVQKSDMISPIRTSVSYGYVIRALVNDNDYVYCGGLTTKKIYKFQKSDMAKVGEIDYGGNIYALTEDADYIYCGGYYSTDRVWKIRKSDMLKVGESASYSAVIYALTNDTDYIYCGGSINPAGTRKVWKIRKSDMTKVDESDDYEANIYALTNDDDYIYCGGGTPTHKIYKILKTNMSKVDESISYGDWIDALTNDSNYVYCGGHTTRKIYKFQKSNMAKVGESISYGGTIYAVSTYEAIEVEVTTQAATRDSTQTAVRMYGEVTSGENISEKGFEYLIQDEEPLAEDIGIEVIKNKPTWVEFWEIGEYWAYEYEGNDVAFNNRLYLLPENTIWWFRACCKDDGDNKYTAESWMKNLPTVETGWALTGVVLSVGDPEVEGYIKGEFKIAGDHTSLYDIWSNILIAESTGNNGAYSVSSSSYNEAADETTITVNEPVEDATVNGKISISNIDYNKADGNGNIISKGASDLTVRGFEVIHEFSGRLPNSWRFEIGGFEGEPEQVVVYDSFGVFIIDFYWAGTLIKTVIETYELEEGHFDITIGRMILGWPVMDDCLVEGKDYRCIAFAENEFGRAYGEEVDFSTWARTYFSENSPTAGETTVIKNENIENLPVGVTASRRGFRYGTTEAADEFDVHENGSFTNGPYSMMLVDLLPDTTYYIVAYIVVQGIVYEGEMEIITTDPEGTEDEDEYPTPHFSPHGQDYREIETKVFTEVLASIGIIEFSGGKKTLPITNHLIQTNPNAKTIANNYLNRFKLAKTRMSVSFPTPLPFEREDTVDFSYGALLFKEDDEGIAHFKEDGAGASVLMDQISMIIKKINSVGLIKTPESIEYVAELDLEHE